MPEVMVGMAKQIVLDGIDLYIGYINFEYFFLLTRIVASAAALQMFDKFKM